MAQLLLSETFDHFSFIEGEIVTFNTFKIDGFIQKDFFDAEEEPPQYSYWENLREYCFSIIRGKRTPLSFHLVFSLSPSNTERLIARNTPSLQAKDVQVFILTSGMTENICPALQGRPLKHLQWINPWSMRGTKWYKNFSDRKKLSLYCNKMITNQKTELIQAESCY